MFRRGTFAEVLSGQDVVSVEDICTTGDSLGNTNQAIVVCGGNVIGSGVIVCRGDVTAAIVKSPHLFACRRVSIPKYGVDDPKNAGETCPLCRDNVPITTELGHGEAFIALRDA